MEFWFHCNNCVRRPENWILIPSYRLTSCGHILCNECFGDTDVVKICKICQRSGISTHAIDATLPPHIQKFFLPPKVLIERAEKRIRETIAFQHSQKVLMEHRLVRKVVQLWHQLQVAKQDSEVKSQLEIEIACLKNALKCLKGELERTLNSHREFEKHALQWGFRALSVKEGGKDFSKEQLAVQSVQISDKALDLSLKGKVDFMGEKLTLSCSSSDSDLATYDTASSSVTSTTPSNKIGGKIGLQGQCIQGNTVSLNKFRANGSGFNRRSQVQRHDRTVQSNGYRKWKSNITYPTLLLRRVRANAIRAIKNRE